MTEDRKNIYMWNPHQVGKYSPLWDSKDYTEEQHLYIVRNYDKLSFKWEDYPLKFSWKLKSELEEKKLRTHDCFREAEGMFGRRGFFIHDWLLECWHDLVDRDIKIIPAEHNTLNGPIKEFHLAHVMHTVGGLDHEATVEVPSLVREDAETRTKFVPKKTNEFMKNHQLAVDVDWDIFIYMTPELRERTLKRKKKLKSVWIWTFKERWDTLWRSEYGEY